MRSNRILIVSYYFPPSGGPGVQRILKFAKYLPAFGWQPTVLTVRPESASYPNEDPTLLQEVPPSLQVERTGAWDPYALYARLLGKEKEDTVSVGFLGEAEMNWKQRAARWLRANVFLPDARVGWVPFAARRGHALLQQTPYDALLTTGPPHSAHLAGYLLSRRHRIPWVADFRDPWTGIDFYEALPMSAPARRLDAALERLVLRRANALTTVSPTMQRALSARTQAPVAVIQNGFDPEDFDAAAPSPAEGFTLSYVGNMNDTRNPGVLWRALKQLDAPRRMPELRIQLVGNVDPVVLKDAQRHGVADLVALHPYVTHDEAVAWMRRSALLLLVINRVTGAEGIMTGKLYEYVASGRPVLGIGPPEGDAAAVLASSQAGRMIHYDDVSRMASLITTHYTAWKEGRPVPGASRERAAPFSRRSQTGELAALARRLAEREA